LVNSFLSLLGKEGFWKGLGNFGINSRFGDYFKRGWGPIG